MDTLNQPQSPQPAVEQIPVPPKPSINSKIPLIVVAIFIVIAIGLITYILAARTKPTSQLPPSTTSPTISATSPAPNGVGANWQTFTSTDKSFSFQYPKEWQDPSMNSLSTRTSYLFSSNMTVEVGFHYNQELNRPLSYEEELKEIQKHAISSKDIIVAGIQTKEYIQKMTSIYTGGMVILKGKDTKDIIWISIPFYKETDQNTFDEILSTFRFLPPSPTGVNQNQTTFSSINFQKRQYDIHEKFYPPKNYPQELINIPEEDLVSIKCTPQYSRQIDGSYTYNYPLIKLNDPLPLKLITEASKIVSSKVVYAFTACLTEDSRIIIEYEEWAGGGGSRNVIHFGLQQPDGTVKEIASIRAPIFCQKPLQLTKEDILYYGCGAYENAAFIYRVNVSSYSYSLMYSCLGKDIGTDNPTVECK